MTGTCRSYYIPGDAVVYGTMTNNKTWSDGHDIRCILTPVRLN